MRVAKDGGGHNLVYGNSHLDGGRGVDSVAGLGHHSVESGVFVGSVVYNPLGAVRLNQTVVSLNLVANTFLSLFLDVVSVGVVDSVLELVMRSSLKQARVLIVM